MNSKKQFSRENLKELDLSEMMLVKKILGYQLLADMCLTEIRKNYVCTLALDSSLSECPPEVIGRVVDLYPPKLGNESHELIEWISMRIPRIYKQGSIVDIPVSIIKNYPMPVSWYVRLPAWVAPSDVSDIEPLMEYFSARGIYLDVRTDVIEMQEMLHMDHVKIPWIIIVSSDWLSTQTPVAYDYACASLHYLMVGHAKNVINYHPRPGSILNEVFGYVAGRSTHFFLDVYRAADVLSVVDNELNAFMNAPLRAQ